MRITDAQLHASIHADPFHQGQETHDDPTAVLDMLAQLFPSTEATPGSIWGKTTKHTARATFKPTSLRPVCAA